MAGVAVASDARRADRDSVRDVPRRVREAVDAGWLRVVSSGRPGRSARYELTIPVNRPGPSRVNPTGTIPGESTGTIPGESTGTIPGESTGAIPGESPPRSSEEVRSDSGGTVRRTTEGDGVSTTAGADPARPGGRPVTPAPTTGKDGEVVIVDRLAAMYFAREVSL